MPSDNKVRLKIMTPEGIFWDKPVDIVTVKTTEGYIGLQKNRLPFVASLDIAYLKINRANSANEKICAIAGGLVFAEKDQVDIITDAIEYKEKIDITRAERDKRKAEMLIHASKSESEHFKAQLALKKALNRIKVRKEI